MGVGLTIMQLRNRAGLTQTELANLLDPPLSHAAVALWESGRSKPRYKVLAQLAGIFNVPMSQLLEGESVPEGAVMPIPSDASLPGVSGIIQAPSEVVSRHPKAWFFPVETRCMDLAFPTVEDESPRESMDDEGSSTSALHSCSAFRASALVLTTCHGKTREILLPSEYRMHPCQGLCGLSKRLTVAPAIIAPPVRIVFAPCSHDAIRKPWVLAARRAAFTAQG